MDSNNDNTNGNKDIFSYYYLINTFYLEIYKNRLTIKKEALFKYITATQKIFTTIVNKFVNITKINKKETNPLYTEFLKYSEDTIEVIKKELIEIDKNINISEFIKSKPEIKLNKSEINNNINLSNNNNSNHIINNNYININNSNNNNNINPVAADNDNININEDNDDISFKKTKRLYIFKTNNINYKETIINKIQTTYLNIDKAFMIKPKKNSTSRDYYIIVKFHNPILFPFKGLEYCRYKETGTSNNHIISKLMKLGDYEEIELNK